MVALDNLIYIEPHRVIIKNITFLVFNYSNDVYISNLTQKIKLSKLEEFKQVYLEELEQNRIEYNNHTNKIKLHYTYLIL